MEGRLAPVSGLFQELRRRKVIHVAAVYLGGVIVGMDFVGNAMETYHLPQGLQQAFGVLVVLGFPVAVLTSWWYDWTAEGIRRVESEPPPKPVHRLAVASAVSLVILSGAVGTLVAVRSPDPASPLSSPWNDYSDTWPEPGRRMRPRRVFLPAPPRSWGSCRWRTSARTPTGPGWAWPWRHTWRLSWTGSRPSR